MNRNFTDNSTDGASAPSTIALALPIVIADWPKNSRETIRVRLDIFKGKATICARVWYVSDSGELKPSPKGLTIAVQHLPALAKAMGDALDRAKAMGLIEGGDE